ncbi:MAG: YggS family pyridoxal phosphate-dependent enzyme [Candidatus Glassbacteria bacterium]|nr:YggS family pyridoxal phosphate-dependent enzyme [Candidatus Glassbacteria bacterium]
MGSPIAENLARVLDRIRAAELEAGLPQGSVALVGVTKNRTVAEVEEAVRAGLTDIGENRLQEAAEKLPRLTTPATRHFIGHLQRNKAARVLGLFEMIQSLDSERLARALDRHAGDAGVRVKTLVQVNTSGESTKFGVEPDACDSLLEVVSGLEHLDVLGLMTIGPLTGDQAGIIKSFKLLRGLFERYAAGPPGNCRMEVLSMGMSADFETAIAEGSNMVRVGTAIFGSCGF